MSVLCRCGAATPLSYAVGVPGSTVLTCGRCLTVLLDQASGREVRIADGPRRRRP